MASGDHHHITVYNEDDDDDEPLNDVVLDDADDLVMGDRDADADDDSDSDTNSTSSAAIPAVPLSSSSAVSIAVLPPSSSASFNGPDLRPPVAPALAAAATAVVVMSAPNSASAVAPVGERKPIDDSRKLFQRLWTDEDEIEILQGFLEYTTQRGPNWSGYHHDTTAFYDQIKSRLQYDCNKNQLVEKLRRLKKKYRTVVSRMSSGKEVVFKTPHDQATFEISRKIWSNSTSQRPEFDEDDQNPNSMSATVTPVVPTFQQRLADQRAPRGFGIDINSSDKAVTMVNMESFDRNRKRLRVTMEEKSSRNGNSVGYEPAIATAPVQGSVEETLRSCLQPLLKELIDNAAGGSGFGGGGGGSVSKGIETLISNTIPMNFPGVNLAGCGDVKDERWRKQQILELEVYSKRLELVQDQIKLTLEELRSRGS